MFWADPEMQLAVGLRTLELGTFLTSTSVREIPWLELVVGVHAVQAEAGLPGHVVTLGGGHDHEPGTPGGPVGVVTFIELVRIPSLLECLAYAALRMVSRWIEEN